MNDESRVETSTMFWIGSGAALMWNIVAMVIYYGQVTLSDEALRTLTEAQQQFLVGAPVWATSAFAIAATSGVVGSVALLMRKALAVPFFAVSLAGYVVQNIYTAAIGRAQDVFGGGSLILPLTLLLGAVVFVVYSSRLKKSGTIS